MDAELRRRVASARVARLATVRPDGRPHIVPITFALVGGVIVTAVDHKPKTTTRLQRLANIQANPAVSVLVDHYDEDWSRLWWARADGPAEVSPAGDPSVAPLIRALVEKYRPYAEHPPEGPVIVVQVRRWSSWGAYPA